MNKPLGLGIAAAGASLGWMVGASGSPIAGAAFPVVFAVVASVFSFLGGGGLREAVEKAAGKEGLSEKALEGLKELLEAQEQRSKRSGQLLGWALLCFFILYLAGMGFGAAARIQNWFGGGVRSKPVPWTESSGPPANVAVAVERIHLAENLERLGYSEAAVREILALPEEPPPGVRRSLPESWKQENGTPASLEEAVYRLELALRLETLGYEAETIEDLLTLPLGAARGGSEADGRAPTPGDAGSETGGAAPAEPGKTPIWIPGLERLPSPNPGFPILREEELERLRKSGILWNRTPSESLEALNPPRNAEGIFK